ncbi:type II secretion system F family protein [Litorivivens sp.]|uniref:type II secretion system F family protein n=1 Tax=Litorivivens sp. TaxID=2020868 RepID=UPI003566E745
MESTPSSVMGWQDISSAHRERLFKTLSEQQTGDSDWDQVFALMRQGQRAAEQADLGDLADQFAAGQHLVIDELKKGGRFYEWELQFMQLGMATGALSLVYDRIAAHYRLLGAFLDEMRRNLLAPVVIMLALIVGMPATSFALGEISLYAALGNFLLALLPGIVLVCVVPLSLMAYRSGWVPDGLKGLVFRLPGIGRLLARYQTFHFLSHLNLCIAAGFTLPQALKHAARRMPGTPMKARFLGVHHAVEGGDKLSAALQNSKILDGVAVPGLASTATALDAQIALTKAVYEDCVAQAEFWSGALPWLLLALAPYVVLINAVSL